MAAQSFPHGWHEGAQALWERGRRQDAIDAVLAGLNRAGRPTPLVLVLQLAYYVFLAGDPASAAGFLERVRPQHPDDPRLLSNLAVCLSRSGQPAAAVPHLQRLLRLQPDDALVHDSLCAVLHALGRDEEAARAGERALELKDLAQRPAQGWGPPAGSPGAWAAQPGRRAVIAFSLWGDHPRYLRGAIDNALAGPRVYPGWTLRFHVDETVPADLCEALEEVGAQVLREAPGQPLRQRLAWRFQVANDPGVGRFLVRDVDSVLSAREAAAVDEWIASGRWFHVMRDWWTHTDLMLAGMWGGVAGVLPALAPLLAAYRSPALETPNIDQWFLRDCVWRHVRASVLVHDRCFRVRDARPWPGPAPAGNTHVGQDAFAAQRDGQAQRLGGWITRLACLRGARVAAPHNHESNSLILS